MMNLENIRNIAIAENIGNIAIAYLMVANIVGFALMGIDKRRAKRGAWRIPEKTLFLVSALGGSIGT